jgi:hypothetical protein
VQTRLGHTEERLTDVDYELLEQFSAAIAEIRFEIGISGQRCFSEDGSKAYRGSDVFGTSVVPVQVVVGIMKKTTFEVFWQTLLANLAQVSPRRRNNRNPKYGIQTGNLLHPKLH